MDSPRNPESKKKKENQIIQSTYKKKITRSACQRIRKLKYYFDKKAEKIYVKIPKMRNSDY